MTRLEIRLIPAEFRTLGREGSLRKMQLSSRRNAYFRRLEASRKLPEALGEASGRRTCSTWLASKPPGLEKARSMLDSGLASTRPSFEKARKSSLRSSLTPTMLATARFEASWPRESSKHARVDATNDRKGSKKRTKLFETPGFESTSSMSPSS